MRIEQWCAFHVARSHLYERLEDKRDALFPLFFFFFFFFFFLLPFCSHTRRGDRDKQTRKERRRRRRWTRDETARVLSLLFFFFFFFLFRRPCAFHDPKNLAAIRDEIVVLEVASHTFLFFLFFLGGQQERVSAVRADRASGVDHGGT